MKEDEFFGFLMGLFSKNYSNLYTTDVEYFKSLWINTVSRWRNWLT